MDTYILEEDGKTPKKVDDMYEWEKYMETASRTLKRTYFEDGHYLSTVFLGLDHQWGDSGLPLLWESLVFGGSMDGYMECSHGYEEASAAHDDLIQALLGEGYVLCQEEPNTTIAFAEVVICEPPPLPDSPTPLHPEINGIS
jgi:hypothetical protein